MTKGNFLSDLASDRRGATIVEFALILLPLCTILMGGLELGYRVYAQSIVTGSLRDAARMASTGSYSGQQIDNYVTTTLKKFRPSATISIDKRSYSNFSGVGEPEPITSGTVASGTYCFQDINNNSNWDEDQGLDGIGGAEDVIYYEVALSYKTLFPFSISNMAFSPYSTVNANTIVSNEPFSATQPVTPSIQCK